MTREPGESRLRRHGVTVGLTIATLAFVGWLALTDHSTRRDADRNALAAQRLCEQVTALGQPCVTGTGPAGGQPQAVVPLATAPTGVGQGSTGGTDQPGVPQAYQPDTDALIVAVSVHGGRLILTYDDGSRVDAGPVDPAVLAIVLNASPASPSAAPSASPAFSPTPPGTSPADAGTPSPGTTE